MWPAGIEPAAPRVSGGRSTGLSYGHMLNCARCHAGLEAPTLFFMPLAYPSTLDRTTAGCACERSRPTWRSFGARASSRCDKIAAQNTGECRCAQFSANAEGLSLSGGASIRHLRFFKLSITSSCRVLVASETTKATRWGRPRCQLYAARSLAHTPLSEDGDIAAHEPDLARRLPGRQHVRGMSRRGDVQ